MGHIGRPAAIDVPASAKVLSLLPPDGSEMSLTELRKVATRIHMSPTTLTSTLRELVQSMQVTRRVDSTLNPRTYYSRHPLPFDSFGKLESYIPWMGRWLDEWLDASTALIRDGLATTFIQIVANRDKSLEKAILTDTGYSVFNSIVLKHPWSMISDFQWLVRKMSEKQLQRFIPDVLEIQQRAQDDVMGHQKNLGEKWFPPGMKALLDMPPGEINKWLISGEIKRFLEGKDRKTK